MTTREVSDGDSTPDRGPLAGVTVIEVAGWMAAPSAGAIMADMGAEVIKVEPLGGDYMRGAMRPPRVGDGDPAHQFDAAFQSDNRGKRSVAVNMKDPRGAELVRSLAAEADVFICNLLPDRQRRYGIDAESLSQINPRVVHATLIGYGSQGDEADRPGYDVTAFWGRSGLASLAADPETGQPPAMANAVGDHMTGLALLSGILAALRAAEQTGEHQVVEASLLGTALWAGSTDISTTIVDRYQPSRRARHAQLSPLNGSYPCADGAWIVVTMPGTYPGAWRDLCTAFDLPELATDPRFDSGPARFRKMTELLEIMDAMTRTRTVAAWGERLDLVGIPWAPIQSTPEVVDDPQVIANNFIVDVPGRRGVTEDGTGDGAEDRAGAEVEDRRFKAVAVPFKMAGHSIVPRGPAPAIGSDTAAVFGRLGVASDVLDELEAAGVLGRGGR